MYSTMEATGRGLHSLNCTLFSLCVCVSARESLLFSETRPEHINCVELSVVESGHVCLLSEESLCEVFLYPGLNYEEEQLPRC